MKIRFSASDLERFAAASHDRNPLHLNPAYARKTPFGQQVVYGALGALACISKLNPPAGHRIAALRLEFSHPMFAEVDYELTADEKSARITDGSTQLVRLQAEFCPGVPVPWTASAWTPRATADQIDDATLVPGLCKSGEYQVDAAGTAALLQSLGIGQATLPVISLLWSSYFSGMELPGERALFFKLSLDFTECAPGNGPLRWEAKLVSKNPLKQIRSDIRLLMGEQPVAAGRVEAFVRPQPVPVSVDLPRSRDLEGRTALVIGASRGLGAAITRALALAGATVLAGFQHSRPEAEELARSVAGASGKVIPQQGDARDPEWLESLRAAHGGVDFLILNACPSPLPMRAEAATVERVNQYLAAAFAMVSTPLAAFAGAVERWTVLISSVYVETAPKEFPQYVAAKAAAEGLVRVVAQQQRKPGYLIVRPPKLRTDMTNTPYGAADAMSAEAMALRIVERLREAAKPGSVEILTA